MKFMAARLGAATFFVTLASSVAASPTESTEAAQALLEDTCLVCHNDVTLLGNMSLDAFNVSAAEKNQELAEKVIRKLRAGMMPPAGIPRPSEESLAALGSERQAAARSAADGRNCMGGPPSLRGQEASDVAETVRISSISTWSGDPAHGST